MREKFKRWLMFRLVWLGSALLFQYWPDLSLSDFDLIPKMKEPLHGIVFHIVSDILQSVDRFIRRISKIGILQLSERWQWMLDNADYYTEGL